MIRAGGHDGNFQTSRVQLFRSDTRKWSEGKVMPQTNRADLNTVTVGGKMINYAGMDEKIWSFDPETEDWTEIGVWPVAGANQFAQGILYNKKV